MCLSGSHGPKWGILTQGHPLWWVEEWFPKDVPLHLEKQRINLFGKNGVCRCGWDKGLERER